MTVRRYGQLRIHPRSPPAAMAQVSSAGDADQHDEGVVIEVAGLELHHAAGDVLRRVAEALGRWSGRSASRRSPSTARGRGARARA